MLKKKIIIIASVLILVALGITLPIVLTSKPNQTKVDNETITPSTPTTNDPTTSTPETITISDNSVTFERILMQTVEQDEVDTNGAGCQWPVSLETSNDGSLMLYGIDVAGLYKSTDHGETWELSCSGMKSRGVGMFAIDPYNSEHILALGLGTKVGAMHISYNQASTWKKTSFSYPSSGARYLWDGLEFDPTTYDETSKLTKNVYFSSPFERDTAIRVSPTEQPSSSCTHEDNEVGLYLSTDGGETFSLIINNKRLADGIVKITNNGDVYVGNQYGLFLINKQNFSIEKTYFENDATTNYSRGVTGLDVINNKIYIQTWDGIYTLENDVLTKITNENYFNKWPQFLEVSKSNPNHIIYQVRKDVNNYYVNETVVSFDGGNTWQKAENERDSLFFKSNWQAREKLYIIDPSNDNNVITFGCDDLVRSADGGLTFKQTKCISNMMQGGRFNFNYYDPDLLLFSAQDYTGVISTDGGKTYRELSISGKGNFYGGFAADEYTIWGFANVGWNGGTLTYTHNGGSTWTDTGLSVSGVPGAAYYSSLQSPSNPDVFFAAEYYSKDRGYTWNTMNGCVSVFAFNYAGRKELYGASSDGNIVVSYDSGDTWEKLSNVYWRGPNRLQKQTILDLAYDHVNNFAYVIVQSIVADYYNENKTYTIEEIYKYDITNAVSTKLNIPVDNSGTVRQKSVAVDPNATNVVYLGGAGGYFSCDTALLRSIDGGNSWSVLTTSNNENYETKATNQGGYEVSTIRVNPYDGRVWIACGCYGYETFDPPYNSKLLNNKKPEAHTIKYVYNNTLLKEVTLKNNAKHNFIYDEDGLTFVSWYKDKEFTLEFKNGNNVYESMTLYAKMENSVRVKYYNGNILLYEKDLDEYDPSNLTQIPTQDGYVFAGWFVDNTLSTTVNFSNITSDTSVYAGWYKITNTVELNTKDISGYIKYSDKTLQNVYEVDDSSKVDNRCAHVIVEKNSVYYISFKMDTRFRIGVRKNLSAGTLSASYVDPKDDNGLIPVNQYVSTTIETGDCTHLFVYYFTASGSQEFLDIKNTIKIYKLESTNIVS